MTAIALAFAALVAAAAPASNIDRLEEMLKALEHRVAVLEAENALLRKRIEKLEESQARADEEADRESDDTVAQIRRIELIGPDADALARVEGFERRIVSLEQRIRDNERSMAGYPRDGNSTQKQVRERLRKQISADKSEVRRLRGQVARLRRDATETRQRIHAWTGEELVILETQRDMTATVTQIGTGGFLSWAGRLIEFTEDGARYEVTRIAASAEPDGFTPPQP